MPTFSKLFLVIAVLSVSVSCSNRWREAGSEINDEVMLSALGEISSGQVAGNSVNLSEIVAMKDQGAAIYYAEAPGDMGPVAAVLNVEDLQILGAPAGSTYLNITEARIFLFDLWTDTERKAGLILGVKTAGDQNFSYSSFLGNGAMNGGKYEATFQGNGFTFTLRSYDVEEDDLAAVIQLRLYVGEEYYGKISTLVGFGG